MSNGPTETSLHDSKGNWIAFRSGKYVFTPDRRWIGFLPSDDRPIVCTPDGDYLGEIVQNDRFFRRSTPPEFIRPIRPSQPAPRQHRVQPAPRVVIRVPMGFQDVTL